ncbi:preprotein translocase subunit SecY [Candidatus Bathyarchaeota archaeon]|nr:preprotein translocase subunit SecY [Candidatus Bathyarchaeota archaeon]
MAGRFLNMFKPIARFIPEVKAPERRVSFNEKLFWTAVALIIYLVMASNACALYGIQRSEEFAPLRIIFASSRGTLMELGIGPIVTAGLILQLLVGSAMIECDMSKPEDRALFTTASKVLAIILTGVQASAYIISGMYGSLPGTTAIIVFLQLLAAGFIVLLLDELIQKGWGFGSGISLFIVAGVAQQIFLQCFDISGAVDEYYNHGIFPALVGAIINRKPITGLWLRGNLPSLIGFIATIAAFLVIIYMEGVRVELPLSYAGYRGFRSRYPIKLLYVSNLPVIFASALFANIYFFSYLLWNWDRNNPWIRLLGWYKSEGGQYVPAGGLVYFVTSPGNLTNVMNEPLRAIGYLAILIVFCVIFSLTWLEVGGLGPSTVAKQLVDAGMQIPGYRRSGKAVEQILKRYIPAVTILGGIIVGLIAGLSDFFGVFGSGIGILLSVGIIYQYYEILVRERAAEMYPAFRRIFGE